ncbi:MULTISPECIES: FtsK/SpoIIIE domain-containing protein [Arthrobacter]|uniref:FHA domain-containing protein n=1 Tax=Arthrobacter terricola TaxID=2547396 RepID=A0A4R5KFF4_9MICC|nr:MULTISPECIES: FtsK/SpoIIIE domain-containing protein [Arthrobacter]MBT8162526.1 FHA domain-containing protein [Arthrobacter sp. GN70]TDF92910.1 FHA domain-containing protein [Arthrobacter terricola]
MTFHCTLVRGPFAARHAAPVELAISVRDGDSGCGVQAAVASEFTTGELTVAGVPLAGLTVGAPPLAPGAVLVDGAGTQSTPDQPAESPTLSLLVHAGPAAGTIVPLKRGIYRIGRGGPEICLPDPDLSRTHATLAISETAITLTDNASANGTTVDGRKIRSATITTSSRIRCGSSAMSIVFGHVERGMDTLHAAGVGAAEPLLVPRRQDSSNRAQILLTAGLPLLLGAGMAVATGMWMFLGFTAISAVAVLVPAISGRKHRRTLAAALQEAAEEDKSRRRRCSPSAAELAFAVGSVAGAASVAESAADGAKPRAVHAPSVPASRDAVPAEVDNHDVWLRLGTCPQDARIALDPADPNFDPPSLGQVPVVLDPASQTVSFVGPEAKVDSLVRFLLMQLLAFPSAGKIRIVVCGPPARLPSSARFLPRVSLTTDVSSAMAILTGHDECTAGALFLFGAGNDAGVPALRKAATDAHWSIFHDAPGKDPAGCTVELWNGRAAIGPSPLTREFDPDFVSPMVFDRFCRSLAALSTTLPDKAPAVPQTCALTELLSPEVRDIAVRWTASDGRSSLTALIGKGIDGPRSLDVVSDGPHLLLAGTTGSGKSELLRTIVAAVSLTHSPAKVNFLFVDFKGGSGLGPLKELPHCVGMLTDLSEHELERTLCSLRAEVKRREGILAGANVPDLPGYWATTGADAKLERCMPTLPRLVLVIDEFRMLIEEAPAALAELMRIATIGRSLGIHLIMATQRPQGAVSADIRANVTTSIALRVQSETESRDIINSPIAASIPVACPGRAYMVRGTDAPELFQSATISSPQRAVSPGRPTARLALDACARDMFPSGPQTGSPTPAEAARPLINALDEAWRARNGKSPRRPVAESLPESIALNGFPAPPTSSGRHALTAPAPPAGAVLGLADVPAEQRLAQLNWSPTIHGHLGLVGPPSSGADSTLRAVAAQIVTGAEDIHVYVLDGDGSLSDVTAQGRIGAVASLGHLRRGVRVLERLAAEVSARKTQATADDAVPLLLVISSWGSWVSQFRSGPLVWAEELVHSIVRDGPASGLTVLLTGDRDLVTSRVFASVPNRAYFPTGTTEEGRVGWPRFAAMKAVRSRAVASGRFLDVDTAVAQMVEPEAGSTWPFGERSTPQQRPFRVEPLPLSVALSSVKASGLSADADAQARGLSLTSSPAPARSMLLGVGGDELEAVRAALPRPGVFPVLGAPGSGKSSLLVAMQLLNPANAWLSPPDGADPEAFWTNLHRRASDGLERTDAIVLVDDVGILSATSGTLLAELPAMGFSVVATSTHSLSTLQRCPLLSRARGNGSGILMGPRSPSDGDFFGIRVEVEPHSPPGRALLIDHGVVRRLQIAAPE